MTFCHFPTCHFRCSFDHSITLSVNDGVFVAIHPFKLFLFYIYNTLFTLSTEISPWRLYSLLTCLNVRLPTEAHSRSCISLVYLLRFSSFLCTQNTSMVANVFWIVWILFLELFESSSSLKSQPSSLFLQKVYPWFLC